MTGIQMVLEWFKIRRKISSLGLSQLAMDSKCILPDTACRNVRRLVVLGDLGKYGMPGYTIKSRDTNEEEMQMLHLKTPIGMYILTKDPPIIVPCRDKVYVD